MYQILITIVFSLFIILGLHYSWNYIKDTYSTKKNKDVIAYQTQKYKEMLEEYIENSKSHEEIQFVDTQQQEIMNRELSDLLQEQIGYHNI